MNRYAHFMGVKFVELSNGTMINVSHIVSVSRATEPGREAMTEIGTITGGTWFCDDTVEEIMNKIVERE